MGSTRAENVKLVGCISSLSTSLWPRIIGYCVKIVPGQRPRTDHARQPIGRCQPAFVLNLDDALAWRR